MSWQNDCDSEQESCHLSITVYREEEALDYGLSTFQKKLVLFGDLKSVYNYRYLFLIYTVHPQFAVETHVIVKKSADTVCLLSLYVPCTITLLDLRKLFPHIEPVAVAKLFWIIFFLS